MTSLQENTKIRKFLLGTFLFISCSFAMANPIAMIKNVQGNAFLMYNGQAIIAKAGSPVSIGTQIITEEGAQISLADFHDRTFHLAGSGQAVFQEKALQLKRGYLWVQSKSFNKVDIITANSLISFGKGEAIISFDNSNGKTQTLNIAGDIEFSNLLESHLKLKLAPGEFSFVDNSFEKGIPRRPTLVGFRSYKRITSLFSGVSPYNKYALFQDSGEAQSSTQTGRSIASIPEMESSAKLPSKVATETRKAKVILLVNEPSPTDLKALYKRSLRSLKNSGKSANSKKTKRSQAKVHIFGMGKTSSTKNTQRTPASISAPKKSININPAMNSPRIKMSDDFEKSLNGQYQQQPRHSGEVNQLIDELEAYDQDLEKTY